VEKIGRMTGLLHGISVWVENIGKMIGPLHGISVSVDNLDKQHHESVVLPY
jgi:hypothetical protein